MEGGSPARTVFTPKVDQSLTHDFQDPEAFNDQLLRAQQQEESRMLAKSQKQGKLLEMKLLKKLALPSELNYKEGL